MANDIEETLSITAEQLASFLAATNAHISCECGVGIKTIALEPDGKPSINALEDPRDRDSENWFFWTLCESCMKADFYSAGHVMIHLRGKVDGQ